MKLRIGLTWCGWALAACLTPPVWGAETPVMRQVVLESSDVTASRPLLPLPPRRDSLEIKRHHHVA